MSHADAPLSIEDAAGWPARCKTRPIAHVAAEMGISRACASKRVNRWRRQGYTGLLDRSSSPHRSPSASPAWVVEKIDSRRRIAHPRPRQRPSQNRRSSEISWHKARLHLPALGRRRLLPALLHRAADRREGSHRCGVPCPSQGLVRRPRHHPHPSDRHRQRGPLSIG